MHRLTLIYAALAACFLTVPLKAQEEPKGNSCEVVLKRLGTEFDSDTIDKTRRAWLTEATASVASAYRLAPAKAEKRIELLADEIKRAERRMPAELFRNATTLAQSLKDCSRSTEVGPVGEAVVKVLRMDLDASTESWVPAGSGVDVVIEDVLMGQTNAAGELVLELPVGAHQIIARRIPRDWGDAGIEVQEAISVQVSIYLDGGKEVLPEAVLCINDSTDPILPLPPDEVRLSLWRDGLRVPLASISEVSLETAQDEVGILITDDFMLANESAILTQSSRISEFLASTESAVVLTFAAWGQDGIPYRETLEVWPSEGGVGVEPQEAKPKGPAPMPRAQIRLRHPKSGMAVYLPEGSLEASPVAMPRGEVHVEYGIGQVYRPLTRLNLRKTERVRLIGNPNGALTVTSPETKGAERVKEPMGMLKPFVYDPENPPAGCREYCSGKFKALSGQPCLIMWMPE